jgi:FtsP/CotA-like multicopper oxidase with cupredoxin domain
MDRLRKAIRTSGVVAIGVVTLLVLAGGSVWAQARIDGVSGQTSLAFTAMAGEVSTPDGGSLHFWGYEDLGNNEGVGVPQYPGPTLILNQNDVVTITLTSQLPYSKCSSIVFPGHAVMASGGSPGLLTQESCGSADTVTYVFTAGQPGTYMYHSGTQAELQIEMGLVGTIIVRPSAGEDHAYNDATTRFDHEYLFLLTSMDPGVHAQVEQGLFTEIDMTEYYPVYWFINGRAGPDDLADPFVAWLPHQPYNATPRMRPGEKLLMRMIGAGQGQHPFHFHGNTADQIARDGRLLAHPRSKFTTLSVPGETVDQIFTWTGRQLGWDLYGPVNTACTDADHDMATDGSDPQETCHDADCIDTVNNETGVAVPDGFDDVNWEYCPDHGEAIPVSLPEAQNMAFGGWWSGSPYLGDVQPLPPGEGGLNPFGGYFFMWHSHAEKELTNFDIFPGGMLSMMVVEPPYVAIPAIP